MCQAVQTLWKPSAHRADCLLQPQRWCHRQWADLTAFNLDDPSKCVQVIRLIAAFIPLTIATLCSYLLAPVGLLLKACIAGTLQKSQPVNSNMNPFFIVEPRELSRGPNSNLLPNCGINTPKMTQDLAFRVRESPAVRPIPKGGSIERNTTPLCDRSNPGALTQPEGQILSHFGYNTPLPEPASVINPRLLERVSVFKPSEEAFKANASRAASASGVPFFFGACDKDLEGGANDLGWGCAWRCIQSIMGSYGIWYTFKELYDTFRTSNTPNEWAEPGYGARVCNTHNIPHQLYLYNFKGTPKTPRAEYNDTELRTFTQLCDKLFTHFETHRTLVMVDDGSLAYTIIGIKETSNKEITFWIADPHKNSLEAALYTVTFNKEGKFLQSTGIDTPDNGIPTSQSAKKIQTHGWMLLFPQ